jgi:hypothetical protein
VFDKRTGEPLAQIELPANAQANLPAELVALSLP